VLFRSPEKSESGRCREQSLPVFYDQGQKNKHGYDNNEEIFFIKRSGSDDDLAAMLAEGHLCIDGLMTLGTADNMPRFIFSLRDALFQFPVNIIGPFTVDGGAFSLKGHRVGPDECLPAIGAGNLLHGLSPSVFRPTGHPHFCQGLTGLWFAGATELLQVTVDFKM
jgi:hypothetical protein